jgi:hypothetical protein
LLKKSQQQQQQRSLDRLFKKRADTVADTTSKTFSKKLATSSNDLKQHQSHQLQSESPIVVNSSCLAQLESSSSQQLQQPLRKSQRRRQLSKKLNGDEYAISLDCFGLDDDASSTTSSLLTENSNSNTGNLVAAASTSAIATTIASSSLSSSSTSANARSAISGILESKISLEAEQKGELKLKIKRVPIVGLASTPTLTNPQTSISNNLIR